MQAQSFQKVKVLGQGTYGKCYLVLDKRKAQLCVLKQIQIMGMTQTQINQVLRQVQILQALNDCNNPFIVQFLGSFTTKEGHLNIVMSYADGGDLSQKIKQFKLKQQFISQNTILNWFTMICLAIKQVHDKKIIHRDLKTQNIFLTKQGMVKLGDFGISRPLQMTLQKIKSVVGTPYYMSPQICQNREYSTKTDIWSLGVILLQMCLLKPPFDANSLPALALKILKVQHHPIPKIYSKQLRKLASQLLQVQPAKRPSITSILQYPIIKCRIQTVSPKLNRLRQLSLPTPIQSNVVRGGISASRGLFIDCNQQDNSVNSIISPKNNNGGSQFAKNKDLPVKRIDNYMKQQKSSKNLIIQKKNQKRGELLKKKQVSQPNLTPKGHSKIQNQKKVISKNNAVVIEKKKTKQNINFKKKPKLNDDLQQILQIKNDILGLKNQFRYQNQFRSNQQLSQSIIYNQKSQPYLQPFQISQRSSLIKQVQYSKSARQFELQNQTINQTLQNIIKTYSNDINIEQMLKQCQNQGSLKISGPCPGIVALLYGLKAT